MTVNVFRGPYACFSNFHDSRMIINDVLWKTVEHVFQANKTFDKEWQKRILSAETPAEAKTLGKQLKTLGLVRPDWQDVNILIMHNLVLLKFTLFAEYRNILLSTGEDRIIEGNYWHDNFWGECSCARCSNVEKFNHLGQILTNVRKMLRINAILNG